MTRIEHSHWRCPRARWLGRPMVLADIALIGILLGAPTLGLPASARSEHLALGQHQHLAAGPVCDAEGRLARPGHPVSSRELRVIRLPSRNSRLVTRDSFCRFQVEPAGVDRQPAEQSLLVRLEGRTRTPARE